MYAFVNKLWIQTKAKGLQHLQINCVDLNLLTQRTNPTLYKESDT